MAVIDAPASEILSLAHVESALTLSIEAGWNQTPDDWAFFTEYGRTRGIFVDGELIATAATLTYGSRLGYVSMILVTPRFRNRGIAKQLLRESVDDLEIRATGLYLTLHRPVRWFIGASASSTCFRCGAGRAKGTLPRARRCAQPHYQTSNT
jgi:GNAT superfamily N-acetyltransferase